MGYSARQLLRALDALARGELAEERVRRWRDVVDGLQAGRLCAGSRTPVGRYPEWVTLEVVTGGFATGSALAAGPLLSHETKLLDELGLRGEAFPRLALNRYYLSEAGLTCLLQAIGSGQFVVDVPEESALPAVAWLVGHGHHDFAMQLVETLAPFAHELRFYPCLGPGKPAADGGVHLESAGEVVQRLRAVRRNERILAQREALGTWMPLYDAAVALVIETVDGPMPVVARDNDGAWLRGPQGQFVVNGGWPFIHQPDGWTLRVRQFLSGVEAARSKAAGCQRFIRAGEPFPELVSALDRVANGTGRLSARELGRVRLIVGRYVAKRGAPGTPAAQAARQVQAAHALAKTHHEVALEVASRLAALPSLAGLDSLAELPGEDQDRTGDAVDQERLPPGVLRRLQRCLNDTPEGLIRRGVVTSGEVLARLLPQRTSQLKAASLPDESARALYAATYRAFRKRRSLLLINLQKQVQLEELPWIAAIERFRGADAAATHAAGAALEEFAAVAIGQFPQSMLPNKLLQEFVALASEARLVMPLTQELAADIFMGQFSPKFVEAALIAARHLDGSLYAHYYRVDYRDIANRLSVAGPDRPGADALARICAQRAGETLGAWRAASNGRILEQQLIVTSHNLAALFELPGVRERLADRSVGLASACYAWLLRHLQLKGGDWRADLHRIKNAAYAWRQMVFFLSLQPDEVPAFLEDATALLDRQRASFGQRFRPALEGLRMAAMCPRQWASRQTEQPFLGWRDTQRWNVPAD